MPKYVIAVLLICGLGHAAAAQGFYDIDSVRTIEIVFAEANWDQILDSLFAEGNEERLLGTAYIDGLEFDSVGVRYKGYSTYSLNRVKSPFNIKLDYIIGDQELEGYGTLKLANVWYDPSFLREVLGYEIARKYMPASLANYANVYVNGTLLGLYVSVQDVDKYFMRTHFHADEGARFKGETDGSPEVLVVWGYEGEDSASYHDTFELESDAGWADLIHFLDTLNNFTAAVEKVLDVDRHLWMLAYDNLLVNLDAPINFAHNYYLFRDDSYRFNPIIWDLNMNFGGFSSIIGGQNLNITQMQQLTPYFNETNPNYPIINRILANATYKKKYVAHMKTIIAENFANGWYSARGLELQDIIDQHVQTDPNKFSTYSAFLTNLESQAGLAPGIVQLMAARIDYLNGLAAFQAQAPAISEVNHDPSEVVAYSTLWITASVSSATSVSLAYRDNEIEPFESIAMFDDGGHEDGSAGDGIYGVSLQTNATDIHYYIYAENANAATFEPTRAEFEDSVISVTSSATTPIVINEFLADNETTQQDQD
ncbi:MAG: CotH kinase family protein, partial [bacterium]